MKRRPSCQDQDSSRKSVLQWLLRQVCPPELKDTPEAPKQAEERLQKMGPMSRDEKIMMGVMMAAIVMWVLGDQLGIAPVVAAMLGLAALLLTGVLKWKECLEYNQVILR